MNHEDRGSVEDAHWLASSGEGRRIRESAGLSIDELSSATGASSVTIMRWENGELAPIGAGAEDWVRVLRMLQNRDPGDRPVIWE